MKIYFQTNDHIRDFFWVTLGSDESIYFGSTLSQIFKTGYCGTSEVPAQGTKINYLRGRPMTPEEISTKHSLHKSGIIIHPQKEKGKRLRCKSSRISNYKDAIPLVGILPMNVTKYPITRKKIKDHDIIINVKPFLEQPFGLLLYVKKHFQAHPLFLTRLLDAYNGNKLYSKEFGPYELCTVIYTDPDLFIAWPEMEGCCISQPVQEGKELLYPIFGRL